MPVRNSIISFDLDMTLLDHKDFRIPNSAMEAVERLRKKHRIVIATGRDMDNHYSRQYKELVRPDGIIHMNGTKITAGEQLIYYHLMNRELLKELLSFAEENGLSIGATIGDQDYYTSPEQVTILDRKKWGDINRCYEDPYLLLEMPVQTLAYVGEEDGVHLLEKRFPQLKFPMFAAKMGADVVERESSKGKGLKRICDFWGIDIRHTAAFGDSMNDLEIIKAAGIGIAMGNSIGELKKDAAYITSAIDQDGIWRACEHFNWFSQFAVDQNNRI